jgi:uncharacterized metal-binding protein
LDVDEGFYGLYLLRRISPLLSWGWRIFWYPYSKIMPHRSIASHLPLIGTAIRVGYLYLFVALFCLAVGFQVPEPIPQFWSFVAGLIVVDTVHAFADALVSEFKKDIRWINR